MTSTTFSDGSGEPLAVGLTSQDAAASASQRWRSVWRIHFYSGMLALPFILFMALTGLVILYTQPIQDALQGDMRTVVDQGEWASFDDQEQAVEAAYPDLAVISMTVPPDGEHSTVFGLDDGSVAGQQAFVDPYTAEVLGREGTGSGIIPLANRLHGSLNNESVTLNLPTVSALWDGESVMRDYVVGDLVIEVIGVWTMVLVLSGLFIWWPRQSRAAAEPTSGRQVLGVRVRATGRARWRDLHGLSGVVLFSLVLLTVISGLAWSTYWGPNFTALANEVSPNTWTDAPASALGERGDLDRLGNQIHWNTGEIPIPASYVTERDGSQPAAISLDGVVAISEEEGMKPGYTVFFPANSEDEAGNPVFGSFTVSNSWPRQTGEARDLFLDQFSGEPLAQQDVYGYGAVSQGLDTLVSVHMGTQFGIATRIMMTVLCVLAIWSATSAMVMFWKRRRPGTLGLPRRPVDVHLAKRLAVIACAVAIVFPQWGVTALVVLAFDRFVIRRVRPMRVAFGQR